MSGENWVGIGSVTADHGFMGNFDGKDYKIQNLTINNPALDSDGYAYAGLFSITEGTDNKQNVIKNLTIENVTISTTGHIVSAAIAYPYYTVVDNIKVCGDIDITGGNYTAGALAYTRRCVNASDVTVAGNAGSTITGEQTVGGVISDIQMNGGLTANYSNFSVSGVTISGDMHVGGISGIIAAQTLNGATVKNVTLVCSDARVGIVAGSLGGASTISDVTVENITGASSVIGGSFNTGAAVQAKIGDTYYATFNAALAAAKDGDVVTLIDDITLNEIVKIEKAITFDLNGKKVTSTAKKAFEVYADTTITNGTIEAANRCVDTREAVELTLTNVTLIADKYTSYGNPQPLTIGGSENGTKVTMTNVTINAGTTGYGIITFVKTELTATNSTVSGYAALYVKAGSEGSVFNFIDSDLTGSTGDNDVEGNSFSTIAVCADGVTVNVDADSTVTATGTHCYAISWGSAAEQASGSKVIVKGEIAGNILANGAVDGNTVAVKAEYSGRLKDEGYVVEIYSEGMVTATGEAVAEVNGVAYATLDDAIVAAKNGGTVVLLKNYDEEVVVVRGGVTIDLNGHTLKADYISAFNDNNIVDNSADKSGLLVVDKDSIALPKDNAQMPVYSSTDGGYKFATMNMTQIQKNGMDDTSMDFWFLPSFGSAFKDIIASGAASSDIEILVRVNWPKDDGTVGNLEFVYNDNHIENAYTKSLPLTIKISGFDASKHSGATAVFIVRSRSTSVEMVSEVIYTYNP